MEPDTHIGIVIVHFGSIVDTHTCLQSLKNLSTGKYSLQVFLIDNDPKQRMPKKLFPKSLAITYIVSQTNGGFASGVNKGMTAALAAHCDYIFFLNNDTIVESTLFKKLLPYFSYDKRIGLLSPMLVYANESQKIWCTDGKVHLPFLYTTYPHMNEKFSDVHLPKIIYSDFGAAALLVKAEVCKKIGKFDEKYFLFGEDVEWCLRAKKTGYSLAYIPDCVVRHQISATSGEKGTNILTPLGAYLYARNFFYILADHRNWFNLYAALAGQLCIRAPFYMLLRMRSLASRKAYIVGIRDGLYYLFTKQVLPLPPAYLQS
jgi:GT2 family glycosyltransferase